MFQSPNYISKKQGKNALNRFEYIQKLVNEYQESNCLSTQQQVLANLCNFAYDPVNYNHLLALNVIPDLFLDSITEDDEYLIKFGLGGIANSCSDITNSILFIENEGFIDLFTCLSNDNFEIITNVLTCILTILETTKESQISSKLQTYFSDSVIHCIEQYSSSNLCIINNLSSICMEYIKKLKEK